MSKTLPISEVKTRLPELVSGVAEREEEIIVTRNGKPAAVLVNYDEYERLKDSLEVLSDPDLMKQIRRSKNFYAKGKQGMSFETSLANLFMPPNSGNGNGRPPARHPAPRRPIDSPPPAGVETQRQAGRAFFEFKPILGRAAPSRVERLLEIQGETISPHL